MTIPAPESAPVGGMRRIVTGHNSNGLAIVDKDDVIERLDVTPEHATFAVRTLQLADYWQNSSSLTYFFFFFSIHFPRTCNRLCGAPTIGLSIT